MKYYRKAVNIGKVAVVILEVRQIEFLRKHIGGRAQTSSISRDLEGSESTNYTDNEVRV
jgi:hypothetical protein